MRARFFLVCTALCILMASFAPGVQAASGSTKGEVVTYHLGDAFLADIDPSFSPDVASAENGDTLALTGTGSFNVSSKSVSGGGTFTHKNASGTVLASGTWTATRLSSFHGYGCGGNGFPDNFCGGRAEMLIHLSLGPDATLHIDCLIGSPPKGAFEGVTVAVHGVRNFNKPTSGATLFTI